MGSLNVMLKNCSWFTTENVDKSTICSMELDPEKAKQLSDAIENSYWFEFFIGKLPKLLLDSVDMHTCLLTYNRISA
jgi:hypothetical protein